MVPQCLYGLLDCFTVPPPSPRFSTFQRFQQLFAILEIFSSFSTILAVLALFSGFSTFQRLLALFSGFITFQRFQNFLSVLALFCGFSNFQRFQHILSVLALFFCAFSGFSTRSYYPHRSRDSQSPICGIFFTIICRIT